MSNDIVDEWVAEMLPTVTIERAWHRAGIEESVYRRRAEDCLRLGQTSAAKEWAQKAAECLRMEKALAVLMKHADPIRFLVQELEAKERHQEAEAARKRAYAEKMRQEGAEKKLRQEAGLEPAPTPKRQRKTVVREAAE